MAKYISCFDVALQANVVDYASPLKLIEYLAMGRAIVAPDTANIKEILQHEHNALLFNAADDAALRTAIESLMHNVELRDTLELAARDSINKQGLTWDHNAIHVLKLVDNLLSKNIPAS